jgi:hypothetical protein
MAFLDSTVLNVALPALQADLGASVREVQWTYGAYALVLSALLLVGGTLGDRFGRRRVFVLGAAIFGVASAWCALAPGPAQLIAARGVQGVGGALLVPASLAIIGASFEGNLKAKAIGTWGALSAIAMAVGPVLGGWLVEGVSWRAAFLINPLLAAVAIPIALWHVPESRDPEAHNLDLAGAVLATLGLGGLVYGLIESSAWGLDALRVLVALVLGLIALAAFISVEGRVKDPMVPPSLFRSRNFDGANLVTLLFYMALTGSLYFLPFLMMQVYGYSALVAGSVFLPFVAMAFLIGRLSGRISARFGTRIPLVITPLTTAALGSVDKEHSGLASGVNNAVARVAGLLSVALLGVFLYGVFSMSLDNRLDSMELSGEVRSEMEAEKIHLGAAEAPEDVKAGTAGHIERAIDESFVTGFRAIMLVSAGLALASALVAALFVSDRRIGPSDRDSILHFQVDAGDRA